MHVTVSSYFSNLSWTLHVPTKSNSNVDEFGFPFLTDFNRFLTVFSSLFLILNSKGFEGRDSHIAHFIIRSDLVFLGKLFICGFIDCNKSGVARNKRAALRRNNEEQGSSLFSTGN